MTVIALDDVDTAPTESQLETLEAALRSNLGRYDKVAVAFSGGVDSALLLAAAVDALGPGATAVTAVSESLARRELEAAKALAESLGVAHHVVHTDEVEDPRYAANSEARCYYCKDVVYRALGHYARARQLGPLLDGMNRDDTADHRPGRRAAEEQGVRSPLFEIGATKADVRALARRRGLPVWDKPAMACLSSRVPHGRPVTPEVLAQVEAAEEALADMGFEAVRVRHHDDVARIEVPPEDLAAVLGRRDAAVQALRAAGYRFVALDLEGYRSGSLNPLPDRAGSGG